MAKILMKKEGTPELLDKLSGFDVYVPVHSQESINFPLFSKILTNFLEEDETFTFKKLAPGVQPVFQYAETAEVCFLPPDREDVRPRARGHDIR